MALRRQEQSGFTLVELAIVVATFTILFAIAVPIVNSIFDASTRVTNTYRNVDQLLPVSTNLQQLIRAAVSPAPPSSSTGLPVPAFVTGSLSPTSMTFYTNVGDPNGPAQVTAGCAPVSDGQCADPSVFTVTEARAEAGTCPFDYATTSCSFGEPRTLLTVKGVKNPSIFTYWLVVTTYSNGSTSYSAPQQVTDDSVFNTCTTGTASQPLVNCAPAEVRAVTIDLQVNGSTGRDAGNQAEDSTTVYLLSNASSTYEPMVG